MLYPATVHLASTLVSGERLAVQAQVALHAKLPCRALQTVHGAAVHMVSCSISALLLPRSYCSRPQTHRTHQGSACLADEV